MTNYNEYGQPIGLAVPHWIPREYPSLNLIVGQYCRLERINSSKHADSLYLSYQMAQDDRNWTYIPVGPFSERSEFDKYIEDLESSQHSLYYAIIDPLTGNALGTLALMRIDPQNGTIEIGHVVYSPKLKKTRIATEAQFLLMNYALEQLGYRRYEWKCDALNEPSRKAAIRLGFTFEGIFRNAIVYKGRSRDTAWYSITNEDWPVLKRTFEEWLSPSNFDDNGNQLLTLSFQYVRKA
ncbi:amino acid acetyltransferase [Xenorhabdus mauleonii]|uniref:Amino acid acetyltransferase n=1 Tax=Xenorhabdus mauleonii TaxID=351675 RepID=A0A1I3WZH9_9GAMM|nr:GNAT family protein [Xenorhabdus mauleonii]PHM36628.1 amino acid acetyltransferase [Xenorhabdus mauleonii]SFK12016.1 Protein N-acetyltransferase, RimJ/RimL family [Xenorhabdus mauleonii]